MLSNSAILRSRSMKKRRRKITVVIFPFSYFCVVSWVDVINITILGPSPIHYLMFQSQESRASFFKITICLILFSVPFFLYRFSRVPSRSSLTFFGNITLQMIILFVIVTNNVHTRFESIMAKTIMISISKILKNRSIVRKTLSGDYIV